MRARREALGDAHVVLLQCAIYFGVPAGNHAFAVAQRVLEEEQIAPG